MLHVIMLKEIYVCTCIYMMKFDGDKFDEKGVVRLLTKEHKPFSKRSCTHVYIIEIPKGIRANDAHFTISAL